MAVAEAEEAVVAIMEQVFLATAVVVAAAPAR